MTALLAELYQDVMQVCRNGHVVTDQMRTCPESCRYHCERCGARTLHACATCGKELLGAIVVPGLQPVGTRTPPEFCPGCGAAFPWHLQPAANIPAGAIVLETLLRRLPQVVRQFRQRTGTRPPFQVVDEHDLEDLVRSLLPLYFDPVHLRSRTPTYCSGTRIDLLIPSEKTALTCKMAAAELSASKVEEQLAEDHACYRAVPECQTLWVCIFDPQGYLRQPRQLENLWSRPEDAPALHCVISE